MFKKFCGPNLAQIQPIPHCQVANYSETHNPTPQKKKQKNQQKQSKRHDKSASCRPLLRAGGLRREEEKSPSDLSLPCL